MSLQPGTLINGRYRVERCIGAGAMGEVWSGTHEAIGTRVAVKRLFAQRGPMANESIARFKREGHVLGRVRSDYVARVLDFLDEPGVGLILVMEFIEGKSLYQIIERQRLSVEEAIEIGCDVLEGLCDLHDARIVHRDLKPGNIILQPHRGRNRAVLVDFGMSRVMSSGDGEDEMTGITRANMALGTLNYMAPEQILNSRGVEGTADLYGLGSILFRVVAGRPPYEAPSDGELAHKKLLEEAPELASGRNDMVATGLARVVARALRRVPHERYPSAQEMLAELAPLRERARRAASASTAIEISSIDGAALSQAPTSRVAATAPRRSPLGAVVAVAAAALVGAGSMYALALTVGLPGAPVARAPAATAPEAAPSSLEAPVAIPSVVAPLPSPELAASELPEELPEIEVPPPPVAAPTRVPGPLPKPVATPMDPPVALTDPLTGVTARPASKPVTKPAAKAEEDPWNPYAGAETPTPVAPTPSAAAP